MSPAGDIASRSSTRSTDDKEKKDPDAQKY